MNGEAPTRKDTHPTSHHNPLNSNTGHPHPKCLAQPVAELSDLNPPSTSRDPEIVPVGLPAQLNPDACALLDLAHDAILVRTAEGVVLFWSRGATELYGHTARAAVGRRKQDLLHTEFPCPISEIETRLYRTGRWDGILTHTCHDGRKILVESRWALQRAPKERPGWIIEINRDITVRRAAELGLQRALGNLTELSRRLIDIQEEERRRLSRELHDEIGQGLTAVQLHVAAFPVVDLAAIQNRTELLEMLDALMEKVRTLAFNLRPSELDDLGLVPALRSALAKFRERTGIEIHFSTNLSDEAPIPEEAANACFRIAQEALTNIIRHARAGRVDIRLATVSEGLSLRIQDDGQGFDPGSGEGLDLRTGHLGLTGMEERARIARGTFHLNSIPGIGTEIIAILPHLGSDASPPTGPGGSD